MHETLTPVDRPAGFGYELGRFTGPLKPLVARVEGTWTFEPAGTGIADHLDRGWCTRPPALAARGLPLLARRWRGYARLGFERIEDHLVRADPASDARCRPGHTQFGHADGNTVTVTEGEV